MCVSVAEGEEGGHGECVCELSLSLSLTHTHKAAQAHGVEVQWCMALAHQMLESAQFPSVTNAR